MQDVRVVSVGVPDGGRWRCRGYGVGSLGVGQCRSATVGVALSAAVAVRSGGGDGVVDVSHGCGFVQGRYWRNYANACVKAGDVEKAGDVIGRAIQVRVTAAQTAVAWSSEHATACNKDNCVVVNICKG